MAKYKKAYNEACQTVKQQKVKIVESSKEVHDLKAYVKKLKTNVKLHNLTNMSYMSGEGGSSAPG